MAKKPTASALNRWRITLLKGTSADSMRPDEKAAVEAAARELKIADTLRDWLVARRMTYETLAQVVAILLLLLAAVYGVAYKRLGSSCAR